jgi:hypothetical protein
MPALIESKSAINTPLSPDVIKKAIRVRISLVTTSISVVSRPFPERTNYWGGGRKQLRSDDIVREARSYIGTPFKHQGREKGVAIDCLGVVLGVAVALDLVDLTEREMQVLSQYRLVPNVPEMLRLLKIKVIEEGECEVGAIAHVSWDRNSPAYHTGIVTDYGTKGIALVHSRGYPSAQVVEELIPRKMVPVGFYKYKGA